MRRRLIGPAAALALLAGTAAAWADTLGELRAGNAAFGEGRFEAAVEAYTRAIVAGDLEPAALAVAFNNRGVAYGEVSATTTGRSATTRRRWTCGPTTRRRAGTCASATAGARPRPPALGEQDQALADYDRAAELDPAHAPTFLRRGRLHLERGEPGLAAADLRRARELDPADREAGALLARAEAAATAATAATAAAAAARPATLADREPDAAAAEPAPGATEAAAALPPGSAAGAGAVVAAPQTAGQPLPVRVEEGPERRFRVVQPVRMRQGPGNEYPQVGYLAGDAVVGVVGESRSWFLVRLPDGRRGFVYQRFLEPAPG